MVKSVNQSVSHTYQFIIEFRPIPTAATMYHGPPRPRQCLFHLPTNAVSSAISFSEKPASCKFNIANRTGPTSRVVVYELGNGGFRMARYNK